MMPSKPYFVSYREDAPEYTQLTYFGDIPEHVTFEFKAPNISPYNENYIILPLDTKIRTAKDLCNILISKRIMSMNNYISYWNLINQEIKYSDKCKNIIYSPSYNFDLYPGQVYLITVTNESSWTQK